MLAGRMLGLMVHWRGCTPLRFSPWSADQLVWLLLLAATCCSALSLQTFLSMLCALQVSMHTQVCLRRCCFTVSLPDCLAVCLLISWPGFCLLQQPAAQLCDCTYFLEYAVRS